MEAPAFDKRPSLTATVDRLSLELAEIAGAALAVAEYPQMLNAGLGLQALAGDVQRVARELMTAAVEDLFADELIQ